MSTVATANSAPALDGTPDVMPPGATAGPWRVEYELGRGGMGTVYAVTHVDIGKRAALKLMHKRLLGRHLDVERMLLEAKVVNQIQHPNIVDIFETGSLADGRPYIVMERLDGVSLGHRAMTGKLLPDQVIAILRQVCEGVTAAHEAGIIHRDLKVDNVFLIETEDSIRPRVKILDWGIAKVIDDDVRHTIDGQLVGTPHYLAPEQARGAAVSSKTDVYSIGVMAYELFLEQLPFEAETAAEIMTMHLRVAPPLPSELWPDIPAALEVLLLSMLAKNPAARPTIAEVILALDAIASDLARRRAPTTRPITVRPPSHADRALAETQLSRRRGKGWRYVVGGCAIAAAATAAMLGHGDPAAVASTPTAVVSTSVPPMPTAKPVEGAPPPVVVADKAATPTPVAPAARPATVIRKLLPPKAPAKVPHRSLANDPDGTIDAYR